MKNSPINRQKALAYTRYVNLNLERIGRDGWIPLSWAEFLESEELPLHDSCSPQWEDDGIQFPRLLSEIMATQDTLDMKEIAESMDLTVEDVSELFDRANTAWEAAKQTLWEGFQRDGYRFEEIFGNLENANREVLTRYLEGRGFAVYAKEPTDDLRTAALLDYEDCD
jgi:hypothetical protein